MPRKSERTGKALSNQIADAIRDGAYRPGEWLRQIDLEERFGATRFDVRTALNVLVARRILEHVPNRGYRVCDLDEASVKALRSVRAILEMAAIREVAARIDASTLKELQRLADRFAASVENGTPAERAAINSELHNLTYGACGNPILQELIHELRDRASGLSITLLPSQEALRRSAADHQRLIEALKRRDAGAAAAIIESHILRK